MAHPKQQEFCSRVKGMLPKYFTNVDVCDIGSLDINGNNHYLFENYTYTGVDLSKGNNVTYISTGHTFKPDKKYDTVISTECFEHDKYWKETIINICENLLKDGGLFLFTCATTGRPEHGTRRTTPSDSPFTTQDSEWSDYYMNLTATDIESAIDLTKYFENYGFSEDKESCDLYFWGVKKKSVKKQVDVIMLASTSDEKKLVQTKRTIFTMRESEPTFYFNVILIDTVETTNKHQFLSGVADIYIHNRNPFNYNECLNLGIKYCKHDWVIISNNDVSYEKNWLTEIMDVHKERPDITSFSPKDPYLYMNVYDWHFIGSNDQYFQSYKVTEAVMGWCLVIKRESLDKILPFDEQFDMYYQDNDYAKMIETKGIKHALVRNSIACHYGSDKLFSMSNEEYYKMKQDEIKFKNKWSV